MLCRIFSPQTLKNRLFWVNGISKSITRSNEKNSTFTSNGQEPWQKFKTFLMKHIRIGHVICCRDPGKNWFWALYFSATNNWRTFLSNGSISRPRSKYLLNFKSKFLGQIGKKIWHSIFQGVRSTRQDCKTIHTEVYNAPIQVAALKITLFIWE